MKILNGKELASKIKDRVRDTVSVLNESGHGVTLAVIQAGDNAASSTYVRNKRNACDYCGIKSLVYNLGSDATEEHIVNLIHVLNITDYIDGILVQLPLPSHIDERKVLQEIDPKKDIDGFHEINAGKLLIGEKTFVPCTAKGIIKILKENNIQIEGQNCVVVGRSNIVGKPVALELLKNNGTVTICHSKTKNLELICREADILICAIGKPRFFNKEYISPNTVVVDVGIHRLEDGSLCGDVDFDDVKDIVSAITPVPGGIGPMTVAMLMENCVEAKIAKI